MKMNMKSIVLAGIILLVAGSAVFGQSAPAAPVATIRFQPYLSFDWRPLLYSPGYGDEYGDYNAWTIDQAGLKVTGTSGKIQAYFEARGFPSGGREFNKYDIDIGAMTASMEKPVYYAWGKYQFTNTGNLWAGKFKPLFGPVLFDWSQVGFGWQQKLQGGHTVSGFLLLPRDHNAYFNAQGSSNGNTQPYQISRVDNKGVRFLALEEYMSKTMMMSVGALWDNNSYNDTYEDSNRIYLNAFVSYFGIEKLTLTGEGTLVMMMQKDGIVKDLSKTTETEDFGLGFGLYAAASYKVLNPLSIDLSFKLMTPLVGAAQNSANTELTKNSTPTQQDAGSKMVDGEISTASLGFGVTYQPGPGFYIQPSLTLNLKNAFNDYQPTTKSGEDGSKVGLDFGILFRWEPSFTVRL